MQCQFHQHFYKKIRPIQSQLGQAYIKSNVRGGKETHGLVFGGGGEGGTGAGKGALSSVPQRRFHEEEEESTTRLDKNSDVDRREKENASEPLRFSSQGNRKGYGRRDS